MWQMSILFLGEASFSFSAACVKAGLFSEGQRVVATTLLSREETFKTFPAAEEHVALLEQGKVDVLFQVDASKPLAAIFGQASFEIVVFMFPAPPLAARGKISIARQLIQKLASSVEGILALNGRFMLCLAAGQGGVDEVELPQFRRLEGNTWRVLEMCANAGLFLHEAKLFSDDSMCAHALQNGYVPTGKRALDSTFPTEGAVMHVFVRPNNEQFRPVRKLRFVRDVCLVKPEAMNDEVVEKEVCLFCINHIPNVIECFVFDKFRAPCGREDRGFRFVVEGFCSKSEANALIDVHARNVLKETFGFQ